MYTHIHELFTYSYMNWKPVSESSQNNCVKSESKEDKSKIDRKEKRRIVVR